ncbi:uncharacterized protein LOC130674221 [Microplitis mediator]|uniref:uncharacterized protein LOC130674221 n=1 Tax=Microplitis mediator TaxID=375433 RepID=UPI0025550203|nr:uncharacterized protein LOC130674221 [Microplitis mediator]
MNFLIMFILMIFLTITNARSVYLNEPKNNYGNRGHSNYPEENHFNNNNEQSSRDLDLSFSLGGDDEIDKTVSPLIQKVYLPEYPEITRELENPTVYYKLTQVPMPLLSSSSSKRILYEPAMLPLQYQRNHKLIKLNNSQKGEIILEFRVTVNNNNAS